MPNDAVDVGNGAPNLEGYTDNGDGSVSEETRRAFALLVMGRPLDDIWPYRLPSLAGALLALVFLMRVGGRLFDRRVGLIAALLLGASLLLGVEARLDEAERAWHFAPLPCRRFPFRLATALAPVRRRCSS